MKYIIGGCTDKGIKKAINQDAYCIKCAQTDGGEVAMMVICDGMGGLKNGEVASATAVAAFSEWFDKELPKELPNLQSSAIVSIWEKMIMGLNQKLWKYGCETGEPLGTTLTAIIILENGDYVIGHVGDSRVYNITSDGLIQLTNDHSLVGQEVKRGVLTKEEAAVHPKKNILLQCLGVSEFIEPEILEGKFPQEASVLLCSDGFRHMLLEEEMFHLLQNNSINTEKEITELLLTMIALNKKRGEIDNISAILGKRL